MTVQRKHMLFLGFGFSATTLARRLDPAVWKITGTSRSDKGVEAIAAQGYGALRFDQIKALPEGTSHVVSSVPPDEAGDPVLAVLGDDLARKATSLDWVAYLSTTGVYGDHAGDWVSEDTPLVPNTERGARRLAAEKAWMRLHYRHALPVHIFRLAGIYGPGRNALESLKAGTAKRVIREGQVFSRIHVDDIAGILLASMAKPCSGRAYNVADDDPSPPQDVITFGAKLLGIEPPPEVAFEDAALSPMARSFYADSKRVSNARVKEELGYRLRYPDYRLGLNSLL